MSNDKDDLIGFRDFIELEGIKKPIGTHKRDISTDHELSSFLEKESERLSKAIEVCEDRVYSLKNYSQYEALKTEQVLMNEKYKNIVTIELAKHNSILTRNLTELFQNHFEHKASS
jgi:hypothetical protein